MRLIDADALWEIFREKQNSLTARCGGYRFLNDKDRAKYDRLEITLAYIENAPEVDAVPVVRCGDCKYGTWLESCQRRRCDYWTCFRNGMVYGRANTVNENDYCSHGAKMESEGGT